jgi:hypothetical protein
MTYKSYLYCVRAAAREFVGDMDGSRIDRSEAWHRDRSTPDYIFFIPLPEDIIRLLYRTVDYADVRALQVAEKILGYLIFEACFKEVALYREGNDQSYQT